MEAKLQIKGTIQHAYYLVHTALCETVGNLSIVKEIPPFSGSTPRRPSYVVLEYRGGPLGLRRQIDLTFQESQNITTLSLKWFYPTQTYQGGPMNEVLIDDTTTQTMREQIERMIAELGIRLGASDLIIQPEKDSTKEVIREKEVIVKVRCSNCANLYDEILDKCPHCGGH